ncbi:major facilitator superfamily domain-containing protein [Aspergillus novoparasiticus]|uniref:Major facilitator superfamily domain-containing protein n=1 Tax=Aspergillus novoparasiticus TaxID=986946 RepID=A0A5N6F6A8_9EURO|nr:major facilitator superfamily domain-containing protein [Aspergillus novoparasiticus]
MDEEKKTEIFPGHMDTDIAHGDEKRPPFPSESVERDGVKIHPPPTSDPLDPLNWSRVQKHSILGIVMLKYFLFTYITTTTVPSFPEIQSQFNINYSQVNWTVAIPALGLSVGTAISLVATIGAAVADSYGGYMTARFFQGFGVSPGSTVGMAVVNDLFFDYERGQKLGLWVLAIDSGLLLGPTFGGFLNLVSAAWINWFNAILFVVLLLLELFFMPETLYPRTRMLQHMPKGPSPYSTDIEQPQEKCGATLHTTETDTLPRTKGLKFFNIRPVPGLRHPKPWDATLRFFLTFQFPVVVLAVIGYSFLWYWWVLSVITMVPAAYATYSPLIQGLLFLGLFIGTLVSEVCCSGRLSDYIVKRLSRKNEGVRVPEMRLWLAYPAILITAVWGISIDKNYHWMIGQIAFFLFSSGIQIGNTVTSSYIIDSYPLQSTSVVIFYAVFLNLSAFINPVRIPMIQFFIANWQASSGWTWTFTAQALIVLVAGTSVFAVLQRYGAFLRSKAKVPGWVNPEFDS